MVFGGKEDAELYIVCLLRIVAVPRGDAYPDAASTEFAVHAVQALGFAQRIRRPRAPTAVPRLPHQRFGLASAPSAPLINAFVHENVI
jgi:hypothetical protein